MKKKLNRAVEYYNHQIGRKNTISTPEIFMDLEIINQQSLEKMDEITDAILMQGSIKSMEHLYV